MIQTEIGSNLSKLANSAAIISFYETEVNADILLPLPKMCLVRIIQYEYCWYFFVTY